MSCGCGQSYSENRQGLFSDQALTTKMIPQKNTAYFLTLFLWNPTSDGGAGTITFTIQYTAPFGGTVAVTTTLNLASGPAAATPIDETIWAQAGTPIQVSVLGGGTYGAATYSYLLGLKNMTPENEFGGIIPIPVPAPNPNIWPGQPPCPCQRCRQSPCCCPPQGSSPPIIVIPQQPPQRYLPRYGREEWGWDDDGPYRGPFANDGSGCGGCG